MIAYLLCAGFGTRMRPLTNETPKSLLPVAGRPLLGHLTSELRNWEALDAIHLAVNHRDAEAFRVWAKDVRPRSNARGIILHVHDDGVSTPDEQLGAVGDLQFLLKQTGRPSDGALVSGGDSLYRFPLAPLLNAFDGSTPQVLALYEPDPARQRQSSSLQLDGHQVTGLVEHPTEAPPNRICPSWHLLPPDALATVDSYLEGGGDPDTLGTFIDALAQDQRVEALRLPKRPHLRLHCNTPEDLKRARSTLETEPRHLLSSEAVRQCLKDPA